MKDQESVKNFIFNELKANKQTSRPALTKNLGIRPATLFEIIDILKKDGVVVEPERKGVKTGRKASPLCFNKEFAYFIGLELQVDRVLATLVNLDGEVMEFAEMASHPDKDLNKCAGEIRNAIETFRQKLGDDFRKVKGIGFADPGLVNIQRGVSIRAVNIPGWHNFETSSWLKNNFGLENLIYPSPLVRAFMEYCELLPQPPESIFHMEIGEGIGGGFIKKGVPFEGFTNCAMEVGHIVVDPNGPLCQCGNRGCLEAVAGEAGVIKKINEMISSGVNTNLKNGEISIRSFIDNVKANDKAACALAHEASVHIGSALSTVVSILNPAMIILSGTLSRLDEILLGSIRRIVSLNCFPMAIEKLRVKVSTLDHFATARGAALLYREKFLKERAESPQN